MSIFDENDPLAMMKGESLAASRALSDYARMGAISGERSLRKLIATYREQKANGEQPPTVSWRTLAGWSLRFNWVERVKLWDEIQRKKEQKEFEDEVAKWKRQRVRLAKRLMAVSARILTTEDLDRNASLGEVSRAIKVASEILRQELEGGDGASKHEVVIRVVRGDVATSSRVVVEAEDDEAADV